MNRTLDSLIHDMQKTHAHKRSHTKKVTALSRLSEIKVFAVIFISIFLGAIVFTNANLFMQALGMDTVVSWNSLAVADANIADIVDKRAEHEQEVDALIQKYHNSESVEQTVGTDVQSVLKNKLSYYGFDFNTLPPVDRVVVSSIWLDVPLLSLTDKSVVDFGQGDFDTELREWVVKYPTTPTPGEGGNTLIFGHTSQERREKNPYGTVFSNIPKLQPDDEIKIVRGWELYTYKVVETVVHRPKDVDKEFQKRQDKDAEYVTLMWCYPLGTTKQRMMVIAERVY